MNKKDTNPLAFEDNSLVSRIKNKFSKKKEEITYEKNEAIDNDKLYFIFDDQPGSVEVSLLGMNNSIPICAEACACCWDKKVPEGYQNVAEYIAKRSRIGHTSVIEHSNFVILVTTPRKYIDDLIDFLDSNNYLQTTNFKSNDGREFYTIVGGSFRGFADIYREIDNLNNPVLKAITETLYIYSHSAMFEDIGKLGLIDMSRFMNTEPDENYKLLTDDEVMNNSESDNEYFKIIGIDSIRKLYNNIYAVNTEVASKITYRDLIKFTTVSVLFKNMTRTCTHQLVRHRNAITQESQRYVDYSKACFSSPDTFKNDRYSADHRYTITFGSGPNQKMTLSELGEEICKIYGQLSDAHYTGEEFKLLKEDARAYLPGNVQCKKIYMTFTYRNLLKFLSLREDPAAQAEIRIYATALGNFIRANTDIRTKEFLEQLISPKLLFKDPFISELEFEGEIEEEVKEFTEEDYIIATGLDKEEESSSNEEIGKGNEV